MKAFTKAKSSISFCSKTLTELLRRCEINGISINYGLTTRHDSTVQTRTQQSTGHKLKSTTREGNGSSHTLTKLIIIINHVHVNLHQEKNDADTTEVFTVEPLR